MKQQVVLLLLVCCVVFAQKSFHNSKMYRLFLETEEQLQTLEELEGQGKIDVWSERMGRGMPVDVMCEAENCEHFSQQLLRTARHELIIDNVQQLINVEQDRLAAIAPFDAQRFLASNGQDLEFFSKYRKTDEFLAYMQALLTQYPQLTSSVTIGQTLQGQSITGLKISGTPTTATKPAIVFNGGQHAREWISPMTVMYIATQLLANYNDPRVKELVDGIDWYLIPIVNIDGYDYTWTTNRLWRKNLRKNAHSSCLGVDPNRNWNYKWNATGGASENPCSDTYRGPSPFSEPESTAIGNFTKNMPNLKGYIDFHSYSQLWMRPWGWTATAPKDEPTMKFVGDACADAILKTHNKVYESGRISIIIYPASGSSADFVYGETGAIAFGVELRPDQSSSEGFMLDPKQIVPTGEENYNAAVMTLGSYVLTH